MNIFKRIDTPGDTSEEKIIKRITPGILYGGAINIVIEGTVAGYYGSSSGQYFLYIFAFIMFLLATFYLLTGFYKSFIRLGIYGSLIFQAISQVFLGGFASSGGMVGWGIASIIGGVISLPSREKFAPPLLYFILIIFLGIFDPYIRQTPLCVNKVVAF